MKTPKGLIFGLSLLLMLSVTACGNTLDGQTNNSSTDDIKIVLSDAGVTVNGKAASDDKDAAVYVGGEIIYYHDQDTYESGNAYGAGDDADKHTEEEAAKHTLVTITEAGTYRVSGSLSYGQIAVDLGKEAITDPEAVVTLVLDGVDINCDIAPAIIFYNVYECGDADAETNGIVDTQAAGANIILADGSINNATGANVAKIYKDGTEDKLHKYDGAVYSVRSMNVGGEEKGTGELNVTSTTWEGLDSEMHLTLNGGSIRIESQNDGINTNEDGVSVTTINGGDLWIKSGLRGEGDAIDSNGWLVINGGTVTTFANGQSGDGGIDADMGITINGGTVCAFGSRNDSVSSESKQNVMQLTFASVCEANSTVSLRDAEGNVILECTPDRVFQSVTLSCADLQKDVEYSVYVNDILQEYSGNLSGWQVAPGMMGNMGGMGDRMDAAVMQLPDGFAEWLQSDTDIPNEIRTWLEALAEQYGTMGNLENMTLPERFAPATEQPDGQQQMQQPGGQQTMQPVTGGDTEMTGTGEPSTIFTLTDTVSSFSGLTDSTDITGETRVTFTVNGGDGIADVTEGEIPVIESIAASVADLDDAQVQITLRSVDITASWNVSNICSLADGMEAIEALFYYDDAPITEGSYELVIAVIGSNETYSGVSTFSFRVLAAE